MPKTVIEDHVTYYGECSKLSRFIRVRPPRRVNDQGDVKTLIQFPTWSTAITPEEIRALIVDLNRAYEDAVGMASKPRVLD